MEASRYGVAKEPEAVEFTPSRKAASEVKGALFMFILWWVKKKFSLMMMKFSLKI